MDVSIQISQIVPLNYNGLEVFTTNQIAVTYKCTAKFLIDCLRHRNEDFIEGVDYFHLVGEELRNFKLYLKSQQGGQRTQGGNFPQGVSLLPGLIAPSASSLHLWSKFGAIKLSNFLQTKPAKQTRKNLSDAFLNNAAETEKFQPQKILSEIENLPVREKLEVLNRYIFLCQDLNLRDDLIRIAFNILKSA